jgi:anti-sigma factor ChrR (cupin superfamily)
MTPSLPGDLIHAVHIDDIPMTEVCAGIGRRTLPASGFARGWLIDFAPGSRWPEVDYHSAEERYFVLSGEILDNSQRYPAGTYVVLAAGSSHRPRSETGARIIGISQVRPSAAPG